MSVKPSLQAIGVVHGLTSFSCQDFTHGMALAIGTGAKDLEGTPLAAPHRMAFSRTLPAPPASSP